MSKRAQVAQQLSLLEQKLIQLALWDSEPPSRDALASQQPFAVDSLHPQQWLQWIFIPKMRVLLEQEQALPSGFEISPYFEQAMPDCETKRALLPVLYAFDHLVK